MERVLLISMPFADTRYPSPALSLLKPLANKEGIQCDVCYLNLAFGAYLGSLNLYKWAMKLGTIAEWSFSEELFGESAPLSHQNLSDFLVLTYEKTESQVQSAIDRLEYLKSLAGPFIHKCLDILDWELYSIIGFTSIGNQQIPSLALANRIKEKWPEKIIAFGGSSCDDSMGVALLKLFPFVDWVFSGEADLSFPLAIARWFSGKKPEGIKGVAYRQNDGHIVEQGGGESPQLDSLPYPDFIDYFDNLQKWLPEEKQNASITVQFSRGCWWGAKSHCIFCGLNRRMLEFRHKSPKRATDEISALTGKYKVHKVVLIDSILNMNYFHSLLPEIAQLNLEAFFVETKVNLNRKHLEILRAAKAFGFQPGIESLDTEILRYMCKGTTMLTNIQLLKWAMEYGMYPGWNFLYGFPGENPDAYRRMTSIIPFITHLRPPVSFVRMRLDRFSPMFEEASQRGLKNIRASLDYRIVYNSISDIDLNAIAYSFDSDFEGKDNIDTYTESLLQEVKKWEGYWRDEPPILAFEMESKNSIVIHDTRPCRQNISMRLDGDIAYVYLSCDAKTKFDTLAKHLRKRFGKSYYGDKRLQQLLDDLVERGIMLQERNVYLSLANDLQKLAKNSSSLVAYLMAHKSK